MRILHLRVANFYGGPERQIHLHAVTARERGLDVEVATFVEPGSPAAWTERIEQDGVPVHRLPVASAYDPRAVDRLRRLLRRRDADVFCTHEYRSSILAPMALRGTRAAWVAFSRGSTRDDRKVRAFQTLEAVVLRMARRVVAVSTAQGEKVRRTGVPRRRIDVVANAIDPARFADVPAVDLRARLGFEPESRICVAGGRFSAEKGQSLLVDAAWNAHKRLPTLRFVLFGDGPDLEAVRAKISALGLDGVVFCPGFETEMVGCLKGADLVVNPSYSEGLPNIVLEAMAVGVPVVATAVGGVPEVVRDGRTGYLVPAGDKAALAERIVRVVEDLNATERLRKEATALLRARYSFAAQCDALERVYGRARPSARS